jgi:hypothetical protein
MNDENNRKGSEHDKSKDSFAYAAFLVGALVIGTIIIILKLFGLF